MQAVLDPKGRFKVDGVGLNFISKVLAVHDDQEFTVHNAPIQEALAHFEYEPARGYTVSQKYIEFCNEMKRFQTETSARSSLDVDAFFYDYWERRIKPKKASQR